MKTRHAILFLVAFLLGMVVYGIVLMGEQWNGLFDQAHIKTLEAGSPQEMPTGSITITGERLIDRSDWFTWSDPSHDHPPFPDSYPYHPKIGKTAYDTYCLFCHGEGSTRNRWGLADTVMNEKGMLAPDLPELTPSHSDRFLFFKIRYGGTAMPRLGHMMSPDLRWQIVGYLREMETQVASSE